MFKNWYFNGKGKQQNENYNTLPVIDNEKLLSPEHYVASDELAAAINVALTLGMPLLLTGEPGCGKSEVARRIAWELGFPAVDADEPYSLLRYAVKSTTEANDLFYTYDAVGRYQRSQSLQFEDAKSFAEKQALMHPKNFIHFQALGLAILRAKGLQDDEIQAHILTDKLQKQLPTQAMRSVVLIDEIDKAPRDVPNDILNELESMSFTIPEIEGVGFGIDKGNAQYRPVVIFTSNSESELPDAFLRRCVYFHVEFPPFKAELSDNEEPVITVDEIVASRLGKRFEHLELLQADALALCQFIREQQSLAKRPGTAEILNYLSFLAEHVKKDHSALTQGETLRLCDIDRKALALSLKVNLLKHQEDQRQIDTLMERFFDE